MRLVEEREQFKRENSTLRQYKAVCAKVNNTNKKICQYLLFQLQKENTLLVKELQLLKSGEGVRGKYNEEEESPRRASRSSRRHSRLDEEEESEASTEGEEEKGARVSSVIFHHHHITIITIIIIIVIIINQEAQMRMVRSSPDGREGDDRSSDISIR